MRKYSGTRTQQARRRQIYYGQIKNNTLTSKDTLTNSQSHEKIE